MKNEPGRYANRNREPKWSGPVKKTPPKYMTPEQAEVYMELLDEAHPNVLCYADSKVVETLACLFAEFKENPKAMDAPKLGKIFHGLAVLGMTPADRSRVVAMDPDGETNPFTDFAQSKKTAAA